MGRKPFYERPPVQEELEEEEEEEEVDDAILQAEREEFLSRLRAKRKEDMDSRVKITMQQDELGKVLDHGLLNQWKRTPLRPIVRDAILDKFSDFQCLTPTQTQLFGALNAGRSVIMNAAPASGKSFIIAAWLLSQERAKRIVPNRQKDAELKYTIKQTSTSLVLVNTKEQGEQFKDWIKYIMSPTRAPVPEHALAQVVQVITGEGTPAELKEQERLLRSHPNPHILVGSAKRFLEILEKKPQLLDLDFITSIIDDSKNPLAVSTKKIGKKDRLIDYIMTRRHANLRINEALGKKDEIRRPGIQLVLNTYGAPETVQNFIYLNNTHWLDELRVAKLAEDAITKDMVVQNYVQAQTVRRDINASIVKTFSDSPNELLKLPPPMKNITHYMVCYDLASTALRPVRTGTTWSASMAGKIDNDRIASLTAAKKSRFHERYAKLADRDPGYPAEFAGPVIETLLEHDKYPRNPLVFVSGKGSIYNFIRYFESVGIKAKSDLSEWNKTEDAIPLGRSDLARSRMDPGGDKDKMTVWVVKADSVKGIDFPGVTHAYVAYQVFLKHEYEAICSAVARDPHPTPQEEGKQPVVGRVVSLYFSTNISNADKALEAQDPEYNPTKGVVYADNVRLILQGSRFESKIWEHEAIVRRRLGRIGDYLEEKPLFADFNSEQNKELGYFDSSFGRDEQEPSTTGAEIEGGVKDGGVGTELGKEGKGGVSEERKVTEGPRMEEEDAFELAEVISQNLETGKAKEASRPATGGKDNAEPPATEVKSAPVEQTKPTTEAAFEPKEELTPKELAEFEQARKEILDVWSALGDEMATVGQKMGLSNGEGQGQAKKEQEDGREISPDKKQE